MAVHHVNNGDGSVTQFDSDTGQELVTFLDPDGSFTAQHVEPAAAAAPQEAPTGGNRSRLTNAARGMSDTETVMPTNTVVPPTPQLTPSEQAFQRHLDTKTPVSQVAEAPAAPSTPAPPAAAPMRSAGARMPVASVTQEGLSPESRAAAEKSRGEVMAAQETADTATTDSEQAQLDASEGRIRAEADRRLGQAAADAENAETAKRHLDAAQEFSRQARAAPIQPAQALGGDKFFFAILANVGASLSNFGSALLGQGATMDPNVVDDIIAESVRQQTEQKRVNIEGAAADLDAARSDQLRAEIQANASLEKFFESSAAVEKLPEVRAAYSANAAQRAAARAEKTKQLAEVEYTRESVERKPAAPGPGLVNPETATEQAVLKQNGVTNEDFQNYGKERIKLGVDQTLDNLANAKDVVNQLSTGQDVPGVGTWDSFATKWGNDPDGAAVQQVLGMTQAQFIRAVSGAAATDKEAERLAGIIKGPGWRPTKDSIERGLGILERQAHAQLEPLNNTYVGAERAYDAIQGMRKGRRQVSDEQAARRDQQMKRGQRDDRPLGTDDSGKTYYESPEAKRRREAAEGRDRSSREAATSRGSSERARIGRALGF